MRIEGSRVARFAEVNEAFRLLVESQSRPTVEVLSESGDSYAIHAECHTAATAAGGLLAITNDSNDFDVFIERIYFDGQVITPTDLLVLQVKEPATITGGTDITGSLTVGVTQKNYGSGKNLSSVLTVLQSDGASDITYTGGQQYHAFGIKTMESKLRDMRGTNIITAGKSILWGYKTVGGGAATDGEKVSLTVNITIKAA